ncbi:MAG: FAD-binding oxidoreductase [Caulobacteraceae bacterium]|nr:FAD-binding oxidoreductase [Caulobacteraceae bacterium]
MSGMKVVEALREALGPGKVATDEASLQARRHDYWALSAIRDHRKDPAPVPACVVRPGNVLDVQAALRAAAAAGAPVIPFGLGSGVVGGVIARPDAVVLDMSAMSRVRSIDPTDLMATFDAGVRGTDAEAAVAAQGLTIGHWPQSVAVSSVGGWVATRASGQFSTAYGNIEDMVLAVEAVLPDGTLVTLGKGPRASVGPDLRALILGSEGALGVITGVTLSLRRAPEARALSVFEIADMDRGFELQRQIVQAGWRPPVMRQYDPRESRRMDARASACLLLMIHEGPSGLVGAETAAVGELVAAAGATPMPAEVAERWLENRNHVPSWDQLLARGLVVDTVEVSAPWSRIGSVYGDAVSALARIPGLIAGSAHSSHAYRSGLNLYFTFAIQTDDTEAMEPAYLAAWRAILEATDLHGGSLSHHHGIGRVRREWLERELGAGGVTLLRRVKSALDPRGMMNPGVLIPNA